MAPAPREAEIGMTADEVVTQLYKDNGAFILSYVTGLLRDRYLAEDVVQETMLRAWRHCARFSPEKGSVRGWLIRVAHNIAVDKIRADAALGKAFGMELGEVGQDVVHAVGEFTAGAL